jgi:hypothetical protein
LTEPGKFGSTSAIAAELKIMPKLQIAIVFVLSLGVWVLFRWKTPEAPLGPTETLVVVVVIGALVYAANRVVARFLGKKEKPV